MGNIISLFITIIGSGALIFFGAFLHMMIQKRSLNRYGNLLLDDKILEVKK